MLVLPNYDLCVSLDTQEVEVLVLVLEKEDLPLLGDLNTAQVNTDPLHHVLLVLNFSHGQIGCALTQEIAQAIKDFTTLWVCVVDDGLGVVFEAQAPLDFTFEP